MTLSIESALRAYAAMMNTLDASKLEPLLAEDFHYASQWVFSEITSKADYLAYITAKLQAVKDSGSTVWAEMGWLDHGFHGPCVVMAQGSQDQLKAIVLAKVEAGKIKRLDLCCAPPPESARRTGVYPTDIQPPGS